jgi:hypothetical protein
MQKIESPEEFAEKIKGYLAYIETDLVEVALASSTVKRKKVPTVAGLAAFLGLDEETVINYGKRPHYDDIYKAYMSICKDALIQGSLTGVYSAPVGIFLMKNNHGMRDSIDINATSNPEYLPTVSKEELLEAISDDKIAGYLKG